MDQNEKQAIEEMAKVLEKAKIDAHTTIGSMNNGFGMWYATAVYNTGYRKQKEGEWIKHPCSYECTVCNNEFVVDGYAEDYDAIEDWDLHYCPNCGAHMKGGAE